MAKVAPKIKNIGQALNIGLEDVVQLSYLTAVNGTPGAGQFRSSIIGRSPMVDLTQDLCPRMGIERIPIQQVVLVPGESGPNGELVYKPVNDRFNQIRLAGVVTNQNGQRGPNIRIQAIDDIIEITWLGTGLNILVVPDTGQDLRKTTDDGSESANILLNQSTILQSRSYSPNIIIPVEAGLTYGLHTTKFRLASAVSTQICGFEVLNESTQIKTTPGTALIQGVATTLDTPSSAAYNSGFESGSLGTRGGRVVKYLKSDNTIAKAVQPVDASALTLASTNHINEEIARTYFVREFGVGRTDDFSTLTNDAYSSARVFTLEDGTTTLIAKNVRTTVTAGAPEGIALQAAGDFITFNFVGTGLDVVTFSETGGTEAGNTVFIDGVSVGTFTTSGTTPKIMKIASGLTYGTHTVRLERTVGGVSSFVISQFLVYQPKKPSIPAGAVELADYNIMANYAVGSAGLLRKSTGVLSKVGARESVYSGTWTVHTGSPDLANFTNGWNINTNTATGFTEYTFMGDGIELRTWFHPGLVYNWTILVDGLALNVGPNIGSVSQLFTGTVTGLTLSAAGVLTGTGAGSAQPGGIISISNLNYGKHTIRITFNSGGGNLYVDSWDVISRIHTHKNNGPFVLQNTLAAGSPGLRDSRKFGVQLYEPNNKSITTGITANPTATVGPFPLREMGLMHYCKTGTIRVDVACRFSNDTTNSVQGFTTYVNGINIFRVAENIGGGTTTVQLTDNRMVNVGIGWVFIMAMGEVNIGTVTQVEDQRSITVIDV